LRLVERTKMSRALKIAHDRGLLDLPALQQLLVRFSDLITELRWIKEIEINPLLATASRFVCLDARVILHDPALTMADLPRPAIRPYPEQYVAEAVAADGTKLTIRPIRPEDEPLIVKFHATLSERSVYFRYLNAQTLENRTGHDRLTRSCFIDYDRQMVLIAERIDPATGHPELILGVAKLLRDHLANEAELAVTVSDASHRQGIGLELAKHLIQYARDEKIARLTAYVLMENRGMQGLLERVGFTFRNNSPGQPLEAELIL
jgi:acetyltransferase